MKVVINTQIGGFGLSRAALDALREMGNAAAIAYVAEGEAYEPGGEVRESYGEGEESCNPFYLERHDLQLIEVVERLGAAAAGRCTLKVVEIPDGVEYKVHENDMGCEWIAEKHRTWS